MSATQYILVITTRSNQPLEPRLLEHLLPSLLSDCTNANRLGEPRCNLLTPASIGFIHSTSLTIDYTMLVGMHGDIRRSSPSASPSLMPQASQETHYRSFALRYTVVEDKSFPSGNSRRRRMVTSEQSLLAIVTMSVWLAVSVGGCWPIKQMHMCHAGDNCQTTCGLCCLSRLQITTVS